MQAFPDALDLMLICVESGMSIEATFTRVAQEIGARSTELAEALSTAAPSINFPRPSITDGTDHVRPATLRGLAPDQTLVLVNSKRRHQSALVNVNGSIGRGSAAVDLNAIPLAAIETVEVLRDGASAQYGSDAIAGVINLRLRDARDLSGRRGAEPLGDLRQRVAARDRTLDRLHVIHEQRGEERDVERERSAKFGRDAHSSRP